jgi:PPOX class probable F420-dependent enzyme
MDLTSALAWAATRRNGVLITLRADGRPQSSDVTYLVDGPTMLVSVTDGRAKTRNMRRDARVVMHVTDPSQWAYVSFDATVELSPVAAAADDETTDRLVAYYEAVTGGPHPNWDEYRAAMVSDGRLLAQVTPTSAVGQLPGTR